MRLQDDYIEPPNTEENAIPSKETSVRKRSANWKASPLVQIDDYRYPILQPNSTTSEKPYFPHPGNESAERPTYQQPELEMAVEEAPSVIEPLSTPPSVEVPKLQTKFGTREFSDHSVNIQTGCINNCKYCYAAERAISGGYVKSREAWPNAQLKSMYQQKGSISFKKFDGVVMYPTTHDITSRFLYSHVEAVTALLKAGNDLVICSKTRLHCMERIAEACALYKDKVTFMVTITSLDEGMSIFWEPNAPLPCERIASLQYLHSQGFMTSVIIEPLLQGPCSALGIYQAVSPYVTDSIWIGTMNSADVRVDVSIPENARAVEAIKLYNSVDNLRFLYNSMKDLPKVKFKSSITRIFKEKAY